MRGILIYNENKVELGQANLILASGFAVDIDRLNLTQKIQRFEKLTDLNPRVKTNAMHISLNFDLLDNLDLAKLQQIALAYMEQIGYGEQPFIVYEHLDAAHPHLHIATTIVQKDARRKYTHDIGRLVSEPARKAIEKQFGLVKAEGRSQGSLLTLSPVLYGQHATKQAVHSVLLEVIGNYSFTSLAEFNAILAQFNIKADRGNEQTMMFQKKGLLYSVLDEKGQPIGVPIKASKFYSQPTLKKLEQRFLRGFEQRQALKEGLRNRIEQVLDSYELITKATLLNELANSQIAVVFRQNEKGLIYGVTYVDHNQRTVFNGSELGKNYSARAINQKLSYQDKVKTYLAAKAKPNYVEKSTIYHPTLKLQASNPLEVLLEKADYDEPTVLAKKRKKKKGMSTGQNL